MASGNVTGFDQWVKNLHAMEREVHDKVRDAVGAALGDQLTTSNHLTPIGIRKYTRGTESHPGHLKTRNQTRIIENGPNRYTGEYFNDASYAVFVALGTYKMRARDFVTPGFYYARKRLLERLGRI